VGFRARTWFYGLSLSPELRLMLEFQSECVGFNLYQVFDFESKGRVSGPNLVFVGVV
jgi:hypothetical protein